MIKGCLSWVRQEYFNEHVSFGEDVFQLVGFFNQFFLDHFHGVHLAALELAHKKDLAENTLADHA